MTRAEVEAILGPDWNHGVILCWASGQDAYYSRKLDRDLQIEIRYTWTGKRGIGRQPKPEDPVIELPVFKPRQQAAPE